MNEKTRAQITKWKKIVRLWQKRLWRKRRYVGVLICLIKMSLWILVNWNFYFILQPHEKLHIFLNKSTGRTKIFFFFFKTKKQKQNKTPCLSPGLESYYSFIFLKIMRWKYFIWILIKFTLKEYSSRTRKGKFTACNILFSFKVCSICFSLTTCNREINILHAFKWNLSYYNFIRRKWNKCFS